ncbi:MAG: IS3 family transposase [Trueperaceae bacterium]|nr:IS3 family transposase [Trueperaceae bacterium]
MDAVSVYRFVDAEKANHSVRTMCRVLNIARAGYYAWRDRPPSQRAQEDDELLRVIREIHAASDGTYGSPRVHAELRLEHGWYVSTKRVERLMRAAGLQGVHRRKQGRRKAQEASLAERVAPDRIQRAFEVEVPNRVWFADVTQHLTDDGWLYLAAVLDAASKRIVGWSMGTQASTELVVDAVAMAAGRRDLNGGLIHHSDRGATYTSIRFGETLSGLGLVSSMSGRGSPHDNAVMESFFASLQTELLDRHAWRSREELRTALFFWLEVTYNQRRRHSTLGMLTPVEWETQYARRTVPA